VDAVRAAPSALGVAWSGCTFLAGPFGEGFYTAGVTTTSSFFAGETIVVTAGEPFSGTPSQVTLLENGIVVDTAAFPGAATYQFPTDGIRELVWGIDGQPSDATWTVTCTAAPYQLPVTVESLSLSGSTVRFRLAAPATVRFSLDRRITRTRYRRVGKFTRAARQGRNRVRIPSRLGGRRVGKGLFRLSARASGGSLSRRLTRIR
jgi:hypothetical protein